MDSTDGYFVVEEGQKKGPLTISALESMYAAGTLSGTTLMWRDGMTDWQPARTLLPQIFSTGAVTYSVARPGQRILSGVIDLCVVQALIVLIVLCTVGFGFFIEFGFLAANAIYAGVMMSTVWQGTVGKKLLGLKVIDCSGGKPSSGQIWGRALASILSWLLLGVGILFVFFTPRHQSLHDMMAGTLVVKDSTK
jgi:uncharacterized RDD family membrane protein YckC